jgi:hypothetical protein
MKTTLTKELVINVSYQKRQDGLPRIIGAAVTDDADAESLALLCGLLHGDRLGEEDPDEDDEPTEEERARCEASARAIRAEFAADAAIADEIDRGMG